MPPTRIKVEHVNPFIASTMETLEKMAGIRCRPGKIAAKAEAGFRYDISGVIGISGKARGMITLSFPKASALAITNKFAGLSNAEINADTIDAVGELANIVAGYAKKELASLEIGISLPSVVTGDNHHVCEPREVASFVIPFSTDLGEFHLTVSLKSD